MIIYRPHKGSFEKSILLAKEYNNEDEMKKDIVKDWGEDYISIEDIVIYGEPREEIRSGWKNMRSVCSKRFGNTDNIKEYGVPQCIGFCATEYLKS